MEREFEMKVLIEKSKRERHMGLLLCLSFSLFLSNSCGIEDKPFHGVLRKRDLTRKGDGSLSCSALEQTGL